MSEPFTFGGDIVGRPTPDYVNRSHIKEFMDRHRLASFDALMQRSTSDVAWFTDALLKYLDIQFQQPYRQVVDLSRGIAWPRWCVDGKLNIVYNCVDKYQKDSKLARRPAVIWEGEEGQTQTLSYSDLYLEVNRCASMLRLFGFGKGDAIGLFMPMTPEIVVALLAIVKIGGIVLPLFSGYGVSAIVSRLADGNAKALFTADGFFRRGQVVPMKPIADEAVVQVPSIREVFVLKRAGNPVRMAAGRDRWWHDQMPLQSSFAALEPTDAEDPLMIIYTSGTTGRPKGAVHTHCGFPVKSAQDMAFGTDVQPGDTLWWMTDMGWMMGPWLVFGALLLGATMFVYDGAPDYPGPDRIWAMIARHKITGLGISPTLVRALIKFGDEPARKHDLSSLRLFGSTGEPWNPDPWLWLFNNVGGGKLPIINYSGGTEISGGIVMGNPILPLKPCAFSAPCPGIAADVVDESGNSVRNQVGELVIRAPWIGMTRGFWKDPQRYEETYWRRFPDEVKGSEVVCFCVLRPGHAPSEALREALKAKVAEGLGKPLQPREIKFVKDLPKTRNAKVMRRIIRAAYLGLDPGDTSSLENPAAVEEIRHAV